MGNASPGFPLLQVTLPFIFCIFIDINFHKHCLIGGFKKIVHKNVGNKIYINYKPMWNVTRI